MPLIQDDANPSLKVLPGSQNIIYEYGFAIDPGGKKKPRFMNIEIEQSMIPAPITVGQAIIFNDSLLHGGTVTSSNRVSIEFTIAQRKV
jgi:ectoine hydroxylase-related dioxygenase (phytanoyl-CoA dioxygenase family)